ncbi:uncharacterized protein LOC128958386 [Oppia nitens]|uniref:uncharacterized protein LOC128958386 n=1 Tax=Oppia nitens TaxID=1686743 RepID=UPI0023DAC636|nr:uncharacterized protein LOC128958386 [Oppia nitens]
MSLRDVLNAFFRFNEPNEDLFGRQWSPLVEDSDDHNFGSQMNRDFLEMTKQFEVLFDSMNNMSIFSDPNQWQEVDKNTNVRDLMLKSSEDKRNSQMDTDLDTNVGQKGLDVVLKDGPTYEWSNSVTTPSQTRSFIKTYSYSSVNNNGRFEEQKTCNDGNGNTETSITQRIGDKYVTKIVKRDKNNEIIETKEVVNNLDQNEVNDFKRQFGPNDDNISNTIIDRPLNHFNDQNSILRRFFNFPFKF